MICCLVWRGAASVVVGVEFLAMVVSGYRARGMPAAWWDEYAQLAYETVLAASEQTMKMTLTTDLRLKAADAAHRAMMERINLFIMKRANRRADVLGAYRHN